MVRNGMHGMTNLEKKRSMNGILQSRAIEMMLPQAMSEESKVEISPRKRYVFYVEYFQTHMKKLGYRAKMTKMTKIQAGKKYYKKKSKTRK